MKCLNCGNHSEDQFTNGALIIEDDERAYGEAPVYSDGWKDGTKNRIKGYKCLKCGFLMLFANDIE